MKRGSATFLRDNTTPVGYLSPNWVSKDVLDFLSTKSNIIFDVKIEEEDSDFARVSFVTRKDVKTPIFLDGFYSYGIRLKTD